MNKADKETLSAIIQTQMLGNQHGRSAVSIERTLRYAIETAYDKTQLNGSFPNSGGKPSNSEVIWTIAEEIKRVRHYACRKA